MATFKTPEQTTPIEELTLQEKEQTRQALGVAKENGDNTKDFNANNIFAKEIECRLANTGEAADYTIKLQPNYDYGNPCSILGFKGIPFVKQTNGNKQVNLLTNGIVTATTFSTGDFTIKGSYSPFTGTHIAVSKEELKIGELVSLHSVKLNNKQPLWMADYCMEANKGVFGVVYNKISEGYLIACVGDAVINFSAENGPCEAGDYLIPSATKKGYAMVSKLDHIPLNQCGKAGEVCSEDRLIAWVKE